MLRANEVAERLNISVQLVYQLIEAGKLAAHRFGVGRGTLRVSECDLDTYIESCRQTKVDEPKPVNPPRLKHIKL